MKEYKKFLENKIVVAGTYGTEIEKSNINPIENNHKAFVEEKNSILTLFDLAV